MARQRILLIDDERGVVRVLTRVLSGYEVVGVQTASAALAVLATDQAWDAVLCDVMMPGTNGIEFYGELVRHHPQVAELVLFLTGGVFQPELEDALAHTGRPVLAKPFEAEALRDALEALVGGA